MAKSYKPFKMKGHTLPGINQKAETENMEDGRSPSSAFQQNVVKNYLKKVKDFYVEGFKTWNKGSQFYKPEKEKQETLKPVTKTLHGPSDTEENKRMMKTSKTLKKTPDVFGDLSKKSIGSQERIDEYKRRGWAMDDTTHPEKKRTMEKKMMMTKTKGTIKRK